MATIYHHHSGLVILKLSKRGIRRLSRLGIPVSNEAHRPEVEMAEQREPRTRGQKRRFLDPVGTEAAAPTYYESSPSFSPPPKRRLVRKRRFFVDDSDEEEEQSGPEGQLIPASTSSSERMASGVVQGITAAKAPAKMATPTPIPKPTPSTAYGPSTTRYAFLNITTHAGEKTNILVEDRVLERIPAYSQKLAAARKEQTPGKRLAIVDTTKRDIEGLTTIFEYLRFGTLPTIKPTLQSIRQIRSLATVALALKIDPLIANVVHRLTNLDIPDTLTFVAFAAEIFRTTYETEYDLSANSSLRLWAEQYMRGNLVRLEDEGGIKVLRRQEGVLREIFVDVLLERWRWDMMMQGAL